MIGKYEIKVSNSKVSFTLTVERNITIIRGDSATGKTTLISLLRDYEENGRSSGVTVQCKKPCRTLNGRYWDYQLGHIDDSIVFIDEGNSFVKSLDFARAIQNSTNYYVIITRENLYSLPYSVNAILKLKTTTRKKVTFVRSYTLYDYLIDPIDEFAHVDQILTEDSNSGFEMFNQIARLYNIDCDSANGKSRIFDYLNRSSGHILVVADGAAFGAEIEKIHRLMELYPFRIKLYLPESFEWLILKSGIINSNQIDQILKDPSANIESRYYMSWEQYFTDLLVNLTQNSIMQYQKARLNPRYLYLNNVQRVIDAIRNL